MTKRILFQNYREREREREKERERRTKKGKKFVILLAKSNIIKTLYFHIFFDNI